MFWYFALKKMYQELIYQCDPFLKIQDLTFPMSKENHEILDKHIFYH
jgi:hypothetical protein